MLPQFSRRLPSFNVFYKSILPVVEKLDMNFLKIKCFVLWETSEQESKWTCKQIDLLIGPPIILNIQLMLSYVKSLE